MSDFLWWRDGVVYQIYPRSFMDSNGDGIGDLEGIRQRLDHLAWLGVDAIWISPFFPSPMADFGYDVANYCDVDPLFGSLEDFDRLLADAHRRGIRVLLDWVPAHTSIEHSWFVESRSSRENPKRDWYHWRDPKEDGSPPNNWRSVFGGSAWAPDETTGQLYLHSHLVEQPDLNWRNPELVRAMHEVLRFWLDRGVDGFRIDVIHRILKDPELRDNPLIPGRESHGFGSQRHVHDENHPDVHQALREIRTVLDGYDERMTVGEVYVTPPDPAVAAKYLGRGDQLNLAFNFRFMHQPWSAERFAEEIDAYEAALPQEGWPVYVLSSHDAPRHASRYDDAELGEARARLAAMLLLSLRGTPFLYYGEEIGMRNVEIPEDRLQDPLARTLHPSVARDPERTPMQWEPGPGAGFSSSEPWLPLGEDADRRNVALERNEPGSLLHLYRALISLRRHTPALHRGSYRRLPVEGDVLAFERNVAGSRVVVALNFGAGSCRLDLGAGRVLEGLRTRLGDDLPAKTTDVELAGCDGVVLVVA